MGWFNNFSDGFKKSTPHHGFNGASDFVYNDLYGGMVRADSRVVRAAADVASRVSGGYMKERAENLKHEANTNIENPNQAGWKALASYLAWTGANNAGGGSGAGSGTAGGTAAGEGAAAGAAGGGAGGAAEGGSSMGWGDFANAASSAYGNYMQQQAAEEAQRSAAEATASSNALQKYMYDQTRSDNIAGIESRNWALAQLRDALSSPITGATVAAQPGYQFGLDQGQKQLAAAMNARGMRNSGSMLQAANQYGQDYAGSKMNDYIAQRNAQISPLQSMAGLGQSSASTIAAAGGNYANNVGNGLTDLASYNNALSMGNANRNAGYLNALGGWYANQSRGGGGGGYNPNATWGSDANSDPYYMGP